MTGSDFQFGNAPLFILGIYLASMLGLGLLGKLRQKEHSLSDFYLGGSSLGLAVLFLTLFATQYSGNTLLGFAGRSYRSGGAYIISVLFMVLAITVISLYAPRLFRLQRTFGYVTPSDFIYHRYGSHALRVVCMLLLCWGLANYILEQLVAMGHAMETLSAGRVDFMEGVLLLAIVMLIYESLGGMRSVAWTDAVQGTLLAAGCLCMLFAVLTSDGGLPAAAEVIVKTEPQKFETRGWEGGDGYRATFSTIVLLGIGVAMYPHAIQRVFAAKKLSSLRKAIAAMAFMPLGTTLLAFLLGIVAIAKFPGLSTFDSDRVTLLTMQQLAAQTPAMYWLVVITICALIAAIMSTADSALLSIASMFTKDLFKTYLSPASSPKAQLWVGKIFGWVLMGVLIGCAWLSEKTQSSIWLLIQLKLEFMVQIAPAFLLGVYVRRLPTWAVLAGVLIGTGITLVLWGGAVGGLWEVAQRSPYGISAGVWGLAANFAICIIGTAIAPRIQVAIQQPSTQES